MVKNILIALLLASALLVQPVMADNHTGTIRTQTDTITGQDAETINDAQRYLDKIRPDNAPASPLGFSREDIEKEKDFVPLAQSVISTITGFLAALAGIFALFMILRHAFGLIVSNGDSKKVEESRKGLIFSLLGLLGIMFSYLIIYTIVDTLFRIGSGGF